MKLLWTSLGGQYDSCEWEEGKGCLHLRMYLVGAAPWWITAYYIVGKEDVGTI